MNRREFLKITGLGALLGAVGVKVAVAEPVADLGLSPIHVFDYNEALQREMRKSILELRTHPSPWFKEYKTRVINPRGYHIPFEFKK